MTLITRSMLPPDHHQTACHYPHRGSLLLVLQKQTRRPYASIHHGILPILSPSRERPCFLSLFPTTQVRTQDINTIYIYFNFLLNDRKNTI